MTFGCGKIANSYSEMFVAKAVSPEPKHAGKGLTNENRPLRCKKVYKCSSETGLAQPTCHLRTIWTEPQYQALAQPFSNAFFKKQVYAGTLQALRV
jgi:hypothetical protein